jgi:hypothetical protein
VGLRSCSDLKTADWIIDLGPEGGAAGGLVIAEGTPEEVVKAKASVTGQYLKSPISNESLLLSVVKFRAQSQPCDEW